MASVFGYSREAVRVKVKKIEGNLPTEYRKFSVDPQITSLEVLYSILAKAFDLKADFSISYRTIDPLGQEVFLAVLSDWDLDAAFLRAHNLSIATSTEPCLNLQIDIKPFSEAPDWDVANSLESPIEVSQFQQSLDAGQKYVQNIQNRLPGLFMNQMEKTLSLVTKALNFVDEQNLLQPPRPPLSDTEFRSFLDSVGQIVQPHDLRNVIYAGGIDPSLRRVVWKHLLNVYPDGMTGRDRMDYMKRKAAEYCRLLEAWKSVLQRGNITGELAYVTSMVRKDVLRTDRLHPFYAGSDDNKNIASLFNILTTYALNHPAVSYCQGMSDIASPLLVTMADEAQAYICFCAVMTRLKANFMLDGIAMTKKFSHLTEALQHYDLDFYKYLKSHQADDLLFCYRWLLLEMKREFAFEDSLRMLEVLWSALPADPPVAELPLFEKEFFAASCENPIPESSPVNIIRTPRENAYTKVCELRRQSSAQSLSSTPTQNSKLATQKSKDDCRIQHYSLDDCGTKNQYNDIGRSCHSLDEAFNNQIIIPNQTVKSSDISPAFCESNAPNTNELSVEIDEKENDTNIPTVPQSTSPPIQQKKIQNINGLHILSKQFQQHRKGHFKELKERIAASKKDILSSLERADSQKSNSKSQKVVKNFNEFLNFASINKSRISDKLGTAARTTLNNDSDDPKPLIKLTNVNSIIPSNENGKKMELKLSPILDGNSPDDSQEYYPMTTSMTRELRHEMDNLDRYVFGNSELEKNLENSRNDETLEENGDNLDLMENLDSLESVDAKAINCLGEFSYSKLNHNSMDNVEEDNEFGLDKCKTNENHIYSHSKISASNANIDVFVWENPLHEISPSDHNPQQELQNTRMSQQQQFERNDDDYGYEEGNYQRKQSDSSIKSQTQMPIVEETISAGQGSTTVEEVAAEANIALTKVAGSLPPPSEFGDGNPFLMFLCLTLLLQHRNYVIKSNMDYNETAMHFDKMVRKHNVTRVLNQARRMYSDYLKCQRKLINTQVNSKNNGTATNHHPQHHHHHHHGKNEIRT